MPRIRTIVRLMLAVVLGVLLLYPLGWLFGAMRWPMYHSWGLMHGAFFSAIPALSIASFVALGELRWFKRAPDSYRRIVGLFVGMAITAMFVIVNADGDLSAWSMGSLSLYALALVTSALLCFRAEKPLLVALTIPLPMAFHDSQFFFMSFHAIVSYVGFAMMRTTIPIAALAFLGASLTRLWPRRTHA